MATTSVMYPHYKFAEDEDDPARRGLFDLAVDVFGGDYDPVIGALPSRVAMTDMLEGTKRALFVDNEGEKPVVIENYLEQKSQDFNSTWLRSSDFLRVGTFADDRTKRNKPAIELKGDGYEELQSSLEGAADFDSQTTYFGYLLQSLVGYEMLDTHPKASDKEAACLVVENVALDMLSTQKKLQTHVDKIFKSRNKATAIEDVEQVIEQRNDLLKAVQTLGEKIRADATTSDASQKMIDSLKDPKIAMIDSTSGEWNKDSFKEGGDFAGVASLVDYLPIRGVNGLAIPTGEIDPKTKAPVWRGNGKLNRDDVPQFNVHEKGTPKESKESVDDALQVLNILIGTKGDKEPGLLTRLARERLIFGQSLIKVREACEKPYKSLKKDLGEIVDNMSAFQRVVYSKESQTNAVLIGARGLDNKWTDEATNVLNNDEFKQFGLKKEALVLLGDRSLELEAPSEHGAEDLHTFLSQLQSSVQRMTAYQYALFGSAAAQIRSIRLKIASGYEIIAVQGFSKNNKQAKLQTLNYSSSSWYSDDPEFWEDATGMVSKDPNNATYESLTKSLNDPASTLGHTSTEETIELLLLGPSRNMSRAISSFSAVQDKYAQLTTSFTEIMNIGNKKTNADLEFVEEHVDTNNMEIERLIVRSDVWKKDELSVDIFAFDKDGGLVETGTEIVNVPNVTESITKHWDHPLYNISLLRTYVGYLEGTIQNLLKLTIHCGMDSEKKNTIFDPKKLTKEQEAAITKTIKGEADAASEILKLLATHITSNILAERYHLNYNASLSYIKGEKDVSIKGFDIAKKRLPEPSKKNIIGIGGVLTIVSGWTKEESLANAADKIWSTLIEPLVFDHGKWFEVYATQSHNFEEAKTKLDVQTKSATESTSKVGELEIELKNKVAGFETDFKNKVAELSAFKDTRDEATKSNKLLKAENLVLTGTLKKTEKELVESDVSRKREAMEHSFALKDQKSTFEQKVNKAMVEMIADKKLAERIGRMEVIKFERAEKVMKDEQERWKETGGEKEKWEIDLRKEMAVAQDALETCDSERIENAQFQVSTSRFVQQAADVFEAIKDTAGQALTAASMHASPMSDTFGAGNKEAEEFRIENDIRIKNLRELAGKVQVLATRVSKVAFEKDNIVSNLNSWSQSELKAEKSEKGITQNVALKELLLLTVGSKKTTNDRAFATEERLALNLLDLANLRNILRKAELSSTSSGVQDASASEQLFFDIYTSVAASSTVKIQNYTLGRYLPSDLKLYENDKLKGEMARNFVKETAVTLGAAMSSTKGTKSGDKYYVTGINPFLYADYTSSLYWEVIDPARSKFRYGYKLAVAFVRKNSLNYTQDVSILTLDYLDRMILETLATCERVGGNAQKNLALTVVENEAFEKSAEKNKEELEKLTKQKKVAADTLQTTKEELGTTNKSLASIRRQLAVSNKTNTTIEQALKKVQAVAASDTKLLAKEGGDINKDTIAALRNNSTVTKTLNLNLMTQINQLQAMVNRKDKLGGDELKNVYQATIKTMKDTAAVAKIDTATNALVNKNRHKEDIAKKNEEIKGLRAEFKDRLLEVSKTCEADKKATLRLEKAQLTLDLTKKTGAEVTKAMDRIRKEAEAAKDKAFEARKKASKENLKLEVDIRTEEGKRKIAEEALKASERLANKRKSLAAQIQELEEQSRAVAETLKNEQINEMLKEIRESNESGRVEITETLEAIFKARIDAVVEELREANLANDTARARLAFIENELPDLSTVLEPVRDLLEQFTDDIEYAQLKFESASYGEIIAYGKAKEYISPDTETLPFPHRALIKEEDGGFLSKQNVFAALDMLTSLGNNVLENSAEVAVVWKHTQEDLEECLQTRTKPPLFTIVPPPRRDSDTEEFQFLPTQPRIGDNKRALSLESAEKESKRQRKRGLSVEQMVSEGDDSGQTDSEKGGESSLAIEDTLELEETSETVMEGSAPSEITTATDEGPIPTSETEEEFATGDTSRVDGDEEPMSTQDVEDLLKPLVRKASTVKKLDTKRTRLNQGSGDDLSSMTSSKIPQATPTHKDARAASWNWFL